MTKTKKCRTFKIFGSHGAVTIDGSGKVLNVDSYDRANPAYEDIASFDVQEYMDHYGVMEDTDILLIGFWTDCGKYVVPDEDRRYGWRGSVGADLVRLCESALAGERGWEKKMSKELKKARIAFHADLRIL